MATQHAAEGSGRDSLLSILRWAARVTSLLSVGLLLVFLFGEWSWTSIRQIAPTEWIGLALFPLGLMIGLILAWWKEGLGTLVGLAALAGFYFWSFAVHSTFPRGPYFLLFALPLFLFGAHRLLSREA